MPSKRTILIINPNTTAAMTDALKPLIEALDYQDTSFTYFTAPSGPSSINDSTDCHQSAEHCLPHLRGPLLSSHDAILVACYSQHPLVPQLKLESPVHGARKPVTGIFEASVGAALQLIHPKESFGIVTTGKVWEDLLTSAVIEFVGGKERFAGVETTGMNATDLHDAPPEEVRRRMKEATKRLVRKGSVGAICLGCAGMAGMDTMVRDACIEELGQVEGQKVRIVDGVVAGVAWLEGMLRARF